jgi:hypothetical protein
MANALFDYGRESFLSGALAWGTDTLKINLIDTGTYTPVLATDQYLSAITSGAIVATSSALASKTVSAGVADAADVTFSAVTGSSAEQIVCYQDTGTGSTSILVFDIDTATGLPVTPNGGDITVTWDSGSNKVFKL